MKKVLDWEKYIQLASETVAEGIVMLRNDNSALPLKKDEIISVFGRIQLHYYKSGTGSGGMVNVSKVTGIIDGLLESGIQLNEELLDVYRKWDSENPFDVGRGWGTEPWAQAEMPLNDDLVRKSAEKGGTAIVIIGRTAGEEQDAKPEQGSFLLTELEKDMLVKVRREFKKVIVLLNVGGLIDLNFIEDCKPDALLYVWQGGMTGGTGTAMVLTGAVSPSGKLPDTIAYNIADYPAHKYFGDRTKNCYAEDIYVGYRYFDTFAPEKVRYPFGYGLSYTTFEITADNSVIFDKSRTGERFEICVKNTGEYSGKEVVMLYVEKPQGRLGQPKRMLCGFEKTKTLAPGESQNLVIDIWLDNIASYDDSGITGYKNCWVLEQGEYKFYIENARKVVSSSIEISETQQVKQCAQALAPVEPFERMANHGGLVFEPVPLSEVDESARRTENLPEELEYTGDKGIKLADVYSGANTMDEFIAQLSDEDLSCIIRGEGMGSPRVTAGTASAFGGVSDSLTSYGIPSACCADGPSGMRLDCGTKAFSLPNGTLIASTFNKELVEKLFELLGLEMAVNRVDTLLGPGMNIHRHPLNGRNFEYFSEDPYLTGAMASAELCGLHKAGVTGTVKHFCANNQETNRHFLESVVSERALREIYLKGFEIAVKEGGADSIMTTYGSINGLWTAGSYDLCTQILRREWNYTGITMTDWWAHINRRGGEPDMVDFSAMAMAQNDLYMVCADCVDNDDNTLESLASGDLKRAELQRNARNICNFLLHTNALRRLMGTADEIEIINRSAEDMPSDKPVEYHEFDDNFTLDLRDVKSEKGSDYSFGLIVSNPGWYKLTVTASSTQSELAQIPLTVFTMGTANAVFTWNGTDGKPVSFTKEIPMFSHFTAVRLYFAQNGLDLISISFERTDREVNPTELVEE
ncbi:MAG: glycoside hydrolase family 3 C-terminal domain-containing protein [Ruminococcus flavefaciens]|nr:glycoside hydrolase family 3 C-terminal domain-containing protein [Ruminococcus flavefaciens]MCM1229198.1 glycoside hydrolase family 3 C-terminal domain-containing protein [Ruminococcus flavefaciens]